MAQVTLLWDTFLGNAAPCDGGGGGGDGSILRNSSADVFLAWLSNILPKMEEYDDMAEQRSLSSCVELGN